MKYSDSGVDIVKGNEFVDKIKHSVRSTYTNGVIADYGGFGGLFDLSNCGVQNPVLVASTDGVGTKLLIAVSMGNHCTIGMDLVAMCVNDVLVQGAKPLFFLDYIACGELNLDKSLSLIEGIVEGCKQSGCALLGGETAEMPGLYSTKDYDIAGFCVGVVSKDLLLPRRHAIRAGDLILGLRSSGLHANGFSLIRKIFELNKISYTDDYPFSDKSWGEILLTPTRIYVQELLPLISHVKAFAHITGGGLEANIVRVFPEGLGVEIVYSDWPDIFNLVAELGKVDRKEMISTFNCGVGMAMIVSEEHLCIIESLIEEDLIHVGYVIDK